MCGNSGRAYCFRVVGITTLRWRDDPLNLDLINKVVYQKVVIAFLGIRYYPPALLLVLQSVELGIHSLLLSRFRRLTITPRT